MLICPGSLMDKISSSDGEDKGSIPFLDTIFNRIICRLSKILMLVIEQMAIMIQ